MGGCLYSGGLTTRYTRHSSSPKAPAAECTSVAMPAPSVHSVGYRLLIASGAAVNGGSVDRFGVLQIKLFGNGLLASAGSNDKGE